MQSRILPKVTVRVQKQKKDVKSLRENEGFSKAEYSPMLRCNESYNENSKTSSTMLRCKVLNPTQITPKGYGEDFQCKAEHSPMLR